MKIEYKNSVVEPLYDKEASMEESSDKFTALENGFTGYEAYDYSGEKIGKVDDLFVDEND
jgi:PRC-barrel domain protein